MEKVRKSGCERNEKQVEEVLVGWAGRRTWKMLRGLKGGNVEEEITKNPPQPSDTFQDHASDISLTNNAAPQICHHHH